MKDQKLAEFAKQNQLSDANVRQLKARKKIVADCDGNWRFVTKSETVPVTEDLSQLVTDGSGVTGVAGGGDIVTISSVTNPETVTINTVAPSRFFLDERDNAKPVNVHPVFLSERIDVLQKWFQEQVAFLRDRIETLEADLPEREDYAVARDRHNEKAATMEARIATLENQIALLGHPAPPVATKKSAGFSTHPKGSLVMVEQADYSHLEAGESI